LIGVLLKSDQLVVASEFFQLFKTPWEVFHPGRAYDVLITTADEIPDAHAKLILLFGSTAKSLDGRLGFAAGKRHPRAVLNHGVSSVPIYGNLLTFTEASAGSCFVKAGSEIAGLQVHAGDARIVRLGYDLFDEVRFLLSEGQPPEYAHIPSLEIHIQMLRRWILEAGISFLEIPPFPGQYRFAACLTHDIDFIGIRLHRFDHSMWGFLWRATVGALFNFIRGRLTLANLFRSWLAAASLPFVYAGWMKDFWEPFPWYLDAEKRFPATYFLIPFKKCPGENVPGPHASRRATAYDVADLSKWTWELRKRGCEIGAHGIDSWHNAAKGRDELAAIAAVTGEPEVGVRMHWLLHKQDTSRVLEQAGYSYDSTCGYNETVGYRTGTGQVFRPLDAERLLELPLHIQDGALFYRSKLDLSEQEAGTRCQALMDNAATFGGVLTLLWHDRSHAPERFWGRFYLQLLESLKSRGCWFGTAAQTVGWFRKRREVSFERSAETGAFPVQLRYDGEEIQPPLRIRFYQSVSAEPQTASPSAETADFIDVEWNGSAKELAYPIPQAEAQCHGKTVWAS
jgi:hypothetical protein